MAAWLNANTKPDESLLIIDYNPVIYTMVDRPLPTPYAFPIFLIDGWYERVVGRSQTGALDEIMARKPAWIVRQARPNREFTNKAVNQRGDEYLANEYTLVRGAARRMYVTENRKRGKGGD